MTMKKVLIGCLGLMLLAAFCVPSVTAEESICAPLSITLSPPEGAESDRSNVEFPHAQHFSIACTTCHHAWEYDTENLNCTTSGCHDLTEAPADAKKEESIQYFKTAFHESCIGCHRAIKAKNKKIEMSYRFSKADIQPTGPTGCKSCHPE